MTAPQSLKLYQIAQRYFNNAEDATAFITEIEAVVDNRFDTKVDMLATKQDVTDLRVEMKDQKADLMKAIYLTGLIQFLAIMGSIIGIVMLFLKK